MFSHRLKHLEQCSKRWVGLIPSKTFKISNGERLLMMRKRDSSGCAQWCSSLAYNLAGRLNTQKTCDVSFNIYAVDLFLFLSKLLWAQLLVCSFPTEERKRVGAWRNVHGCHTRCTRSWRHRRGQKGSIHCLVCLFSRDFLTSLVHY